MFSEVKQQKAGLATASGLLIFIGICLIIVSYSVYGIGSQLINEGSCTIKEHSILKRTVPVGIEHTPTEQCLAIFNVDFDSDNKEITLQKRAALKSIGGDWVPCNKVQQTLEGYPDGITHDCITGSDTLDYGDVISGKTVWHFNQMVYLGSSAQDTRAAFLGFLITGIIMIVCCSGLCLFGLFCHRDRYEYVSI